MKNFINFLPPWVETNIQPAFYDKESGTCLQQTARMYAKVNQLVRIANEQYAKITEFINKFLELEDFVDDYFENLDVQEEINNKLDVMAQDGTLGELLNNYMKPYIDEKIDDVSDNINHLYDILSDTMDLSPKGAYSTVSALESADPATGIYIVTANGHIYNWTHGGSATDLGAYQTAVNNQTVDVLNTKDWIHTKLDNNEYHHYPTMVRKQLSANGTESDSTTRLASSEYFRLDSSDQVNANLSYLVCTLVFDKDGDALGYYPYNTTPNNASYRSVIFAKDIYAAYPTADSVRIMARHVEGTEPILVTEATNIQLILSSAQKISYYADSLNKLNTIATSYYNGVYGTSGNLIDNTTRLVTNEYIPIEYFNLIEAEDGYEIGLACWDRTTRDWIGYVKDSSGATQTSGVYMSSLDTSSLTDQRLYRVLIRNADTTSEVNPLTDYDKAKLFFKTPNLLTSYCEVTDGGVVVTDTADASNDIWSEYDGRLAFGMNTSTAKVPTINNQQLVNYGTLITMKNGGNNRWGYHALECYDNTNYNRITLLTDKHIEYGRNVAEFYYYTGASHANASYGNFKLGSDVRNHSFSFNRDEMIADGAINAHSVIQLARINPSTDLITTYDNYAQADSAYDPENAGTSANNAKCCRYIQLKNAENGAMFYDTNRNKLVCKVDGVWSDVNVTPVPDGTYPF